MPLIIGDVIIQRNWMRAVVSTLIPDKDDINTAITRYNKVVEYIIGNKLKNTSAVDVISRIFPELEVRSKSLSNKILNKNDISDEVRKFVLNINKPVIERDVDNPNKNTFDFVRVYLSIPTKESYPDRHGFIQNNMKQFVLLALERIKNEKSFQKYGVPVNILKLEHMVITQQSELMMLFCVKTIK